MSAEFVVGFARQAIEITLLISAPMLGLGLVVGLLIAVFQAVTQIQEMTLTFIPKILAIMAALFIFFPWILEKLVVYTQNLIINIPNYIR